MIPPLIILSCFVSIISWIFLPSSSWFLFLLQLDDDYQFPTSHILSYIINWLSVIVNPIIYVATQKRYQEAIRLLFIKWFKRQDYPEELRAIRRTSSVIQRQLSTISNSPSPWMLISNDTHPNVLTKKVKVFLLINVAFFARAKNIQFHGWLSCTYFF